MTLDWRSNTSSGCVVSVQFVQLHVSHNPDGVVKYGIIMTFKCVCLKDPSFTLSPPDGSLRTGTPTGGTISTLTFIDSECSHAAVWPLTSHNDTQDRLLFKDEPFNLQQRCREGRELPSHLNGRRTLRMVTGSGPLWGTWRPSSAHNLLSHFCLEPTIYPAHPSFPFFSQQPKTPENCNYSD